MKTKDHDKKNSYDGEFVGTFPVQTLQNEDAGVPYLVRQCAYHGMQFAAFCFQQKPSRKHNHWICIADSR